MAEPQQMSRDQARKHVEAIAEKAMYFDEDEFSLLSTKAQNAIIQGRKWMETCGNMTESISIGNYSQDGRFIHELIQNADDKGFQTARKRGNDSYIKFTINPHCIVVDSSQDCFTAGDVDSICDVSNSKKKSDCDKIGEKGMGFKSVFKVAWKVQIQSGPFSFFFRHRPEDPNWNMTIPIYEDLTALEDRTVTRITLHLHENISLQDIHGHFVHLPFKSLLFLRNLKKIQVVDNWSALAQNICTWITNRGGKEKKLELITITEERSQMRPGKHLFQIFRKDALQLPEDKLRSNVDQTRVELAFPIYEDHSPRIEDQEVYAFLPLKDFGFNFLIQADFITQVSRQDVIESARNRELLRRIAATFQEAVVHFSSDGSPQFDKLQYQWTRYVSEASVSDRFWRQLSEDIKTVLRETKCLKSWSPGPLKFPQELKIVRETALDEDEPPQPLLADAEDQTYLAPEYQSENAIVYLGDLGVRHQEMSDIIQRLESDVAAGTQSRMKRTANDSDWHQLMAKLLLTVFTENKNSKFQDPVRKLRLVPVRNGQDIELESCTQGPVYFPGNDEAPIPSDIGLKLVDPAAVQDQFRRELFHHLGVDHCPSQKAIEHIHLQYTKTGRVGGSTSLAHLRYLYWNTCTTSTKSNYKWPSYLWVYDQRGSQVRPSGEDIYFQSTEEYSAQALLGDCPNPQESKSDFVVHFIHPDYLKKCQSRPGEIDFKSWLSKYVGVKEKIRLTKRGNKAKLSDEVLYVCDSHPDKVVGMLKKHWSGSPHVSDIEGLAAISQRSVPTLAGYLHPLQETYLPLPDLIQRASEFGVNESFGFLKMPLELTDESISAWRFLNQLHVGIEPDLGFYLSILREIVDENNGKTNSMLEDPVLDAYTAISRHGTTPEHVIKIRETFASNELFLVPENSRFVVTEGGMWTGTSSCVWNGPSVMRLKIVLADSQRYLDDPILKHFFRNTLEVQDADWKDVVRELTDLAENGFSDFDQESEHLGIASRFYAYFEQFHSSQVDWSEARENFEVANLVYNSTEKQWYPISKCLWSSMVKIPGKVTLSSDYPHLEDFFVKRLQVEKADFKTLVRELKSLAGNTDYVLEIKEIIRAISLMMPEKGSLQDLEGLDVLPVNSPHSKQTQLWNTEQPFAIIDRLKLGRGFKNAQPQAASLLDFELEDFKLLQPFIQAMNLEDRCLSRLSKEESKATGKTLHEGLTKGFQDRAYHLLCCAVNFDSPKAKKDRNSFYELLLNSEVYISDTITSYISITQRGQQIRFESEKCNAHVEQNGTKFHIVVPRADRNREMSYLKDLPRRLLSFFGIGEAAEAIMIHLLNSSLYLLDDLLDDAGILGVPDIVRRSRTPDVDSRAENIPNNLGRSEANHGHSTPPRIHKMPDYTETRSSHHHESRIIPKYEPIRDQIFPSPRDLTESSTTNTTAPSHSVTSHSSSSSEARSRSDSIVSERRSTTSYEGSEEDLSLSQISILMTYDDILRKVISTARSSSHHGIATQGSFRASGVEPPSDSDSQLISSEDFRGLGLPFGIHSHTPLSLSDIGAAGELFVFEVLKGMQMPDFDVGNWQSRIRHLVKSRPEYNTMENWTDKETSDIVYEDIKKQLTNYLLTHGYLGENLWEYTEKGPKYFLEVKTTLQGCDHPFYVSKGQYALMEESKMVPNVPAKQIYVLCRVFNLGKEDMGMRIYVDPWNMKQDEELKFTETNYSVVPAKRGDRR